MDVPAIDESEIAEGGVFSVTREAIPDLGQRLQEMEKKPKRTCPDLSGLTVPLTKRFPQKVRIKPMLPFARFIESRHVQTVITILFIVDVIIVLAELIIETEILRLERNICESELHALQNETHDCAATKTRATLQKLPKRASTEPANSTAPDPGGGSSLQTLQGLETAEEVLHWISIGILVGIVVLFVLVCHAYSYEICLRASLRSSC
jgi:hypothetical protein